MFRYLDDWRRREEEMLQRAVAHSASPLEQAKRMCSAGAPLPASKMKSSDDSEAATFPSVVEKGANSNWATPSIPITAIVQLEPGAMARAKKLSLAMKRAPSSVDGARFRGLGEALRRLERSRVFDGFCSVVILANSVFLAISTEQNMQPLTAETIAAHQAADQVFCVLYSLELFVRVGAKQWRFFFDEDWRWSWFDFVLVCFAVYEQCTALFSSSQQGGGVNVSYLRVMRLLKMLKVLRVVRLMKDFRELRLTLDSLMGSMKSMFWSVVLVAAIAFMFSLCFMQGVADYLGGERGTLEEEMLLQQWGTITTSMLSLFMAATGGVDWKDTLDPLWDVGRQFGAIFVVFIAFFSFVVMNSITSIFVEGARDYAERDDSAVIQDQLSRKEEYMTKVTAMYQQMDHTDCGEVTFDTFQRHMSDARMVAFAESLDIDTSNLEQFFNILSQNGRRAVDLETFVVGCIKLRGMAKSMDMMDVLISQRRLTEEQARMAHRLEECFSQIHLMFEGGSAGHSPRRARSKDGADGGHAELALPNAMSC